MSKKYKEAMDKNRSFRELKTKIIENIAENGPAVKVNPKHTKMFYFRRSIGYAACLLLCLLTVSVSKDFTGIDLLPSADDVPDYVLSVRELTDAISPVQQTNDVLPRTQAPGNNSADEKNPFETSLGDGNDQIVSSVNPSVDAESFSDVREQLGYDFKVPQYLPEGYELDTVSLMFETLVQISYLSENDQIVYRTEKTDIDISGDYNVYDTVETVTVNNADTTLRGSGELFYGAVWNDGDMSYSLSSMNGLDKDTIIRIVESADYI